MDITVIYAIKLLLLPPTGLLLSLFLGLLWRKNRLGWWIALASLSILWLLSLPVVVRSAAEYWETYPVLTQAQLTAIAPQAIVVIGGGLTHHAAEYHRTLTVNARSLLRLRYAAKLKRETGLPLLVSGGKVSADTAFSEAQVIADVLQEEFNVKVDWQEDRSRNTAENAQLSYRLLNAQGVNNIILVTQAYHMPRALFEFKRAGFEVLAAPTDFMRRSVAISIFDWLPSTTALHNSFLMTHEMLGILWYRLRY